MLARIRRAGALALLAAALVLAIAPQPGEQLLPVLVAARDLAAGSTLRPADVQIRHTPAELAPGGALDTPGGAVGRVLASAARAGEPLTDVRLVGAAGGELPGDPGVSAVPIRLSDPAVAELLRPGTRVNVIALDGEKGARLLAGGVRVVTVTEPREQSTYNHPNGRIVLISAPSHLATRIAAASLNQPVTVTLR